MADTPTTPFSITGGCACKAIRYRVNVPDHSNRLRLPYKSDNANIGNDKRMPYSVMCTCNDCRRHTSNVFPTVLIVDHGTMEMSVLEDGKDRGLSDGERSWKPVGEVWNASVDSSGRASVVGRYQSSPGRNRWFCADCGTPLAYSVDEDVMKKLGWPKMVDIWTGSLDRECLEQEWMRPRHRFWGYMGIPWVREHMGRMSDMGESPLFKIDQTWDDDLSADLEMLKSMGKM